MQEYNDLIETLNKATKAYDEGKPIMSDSDWDRLYWKAVEWEKNHTPHIDSPTQKVNYRVVNELVKVKHTSPMLSLDKTKSLEELNNFRQGNNSFISLKLDGLTCRLTYVGGRLVQAETRGNGEIGEDITHNAMAIKGIPKSLKLPVNLTLDGEVICTDADFIPFKEEYKNSRNFAAGSVRLLDANECFNRNLTFVVWEIVNGMEEDNFTLHTEKLTNLLDYGNFITVPFYTCTQEITQDQIDFMKHTAHGAGYPIDGLVLKYDNILFGRSLGATSHHWRNGIAFKFFDESYPSTLRDIEYSMGRTGQLTPVAIFDPIELDGSIVTRASLHNLSIMDALSDGLQCVGDIVYVYKSNEIIPQISKWNHTGSPRRQLQVPKICPVCGGITKVVYENLTATLECTNPDCEGRLINRLDHFCSKDRGLDIRGLSKSTLEKLVEWGWVNSIYDLFTLHEHKTEWVQKPGFGATSVAKILAAIEDSKSPPLNAFICSLGIPLIGRTVSKQLLKITPSYLDFRDKIKSRYDFSVHPTFGYEKSKALLDFDYTEADKIYELLYIQDPVEEEKKENLAGLTFCITGKLTQHKNRDELVDIIEKNGGRFVKSVSKNTNYLINNDALSTSAKNKEAQALGIPIITEKDFLKMI